nr:CPARA 3gp363 [Cryptomonas curvata]
MLIDFKNSYQISILFNQIIFKKKKNLSSIIHNPFLLKDFKKKFIDIFLKKKFTKSINLRGEDCILNCFNNCILTYSSSNFISLNLDKNLRCNQKKKPYKILKKHKKPILRNWKEKILSNHRIGQIVLINNIQKICPNYICGTLTTGFYYFINEKDISLYPLKYIKFIKNKLYIFPAKITAIYPSMMQIRLSIVTKNYFFSLSKSTNFFFLFSWIKKKKIKTSSEISKPLVLS